MIDIFFSLNLPDGYHYHRRVFISRVVVPPAFPLALADALYDAYQHPRVS